MAGNDSERSFLQSDDCVIVASVTEHPTFIVRLKYSKVSSLLSLYVVVILPWTWRHWVSTEVDCMT